jgi:hypothetical protein
MLLGLCFGTSFIAWFLCFIVDFVNDENLLYKEEKEKISQELDENIKT